MTENVRGTMDAQDFLNIIFAALTFLAGWIMRFIHGRLNRLEDRDVQLEARMHKIDVLVAGKYVTREEVDARHNILWSQLIARLDSIEQKMDRKVDKRDT